MYPMLALFLQTVCYRVKVTQDVEKALKGILVISTIPMTPVVFCRSKACLPHILNMGYGYVDVKWWYCAVSIMLGVRSGLIIGYITGTTLPTAASGPRGYGDPGAVCRHWHHRGVRGGGDPELSPRGAVCLPRSDPHRVPLVGSQPGSEQHTGKLQQPRVRPTSHSAGVRGDPLPGLEAATAPKGVDIAGQEVHRASLHHTWWLRCVGRGGLFRGSCSPHRGGCSHRICAAPNPYHLHGRFFHYSCADQKEGLWR